MKVFYLDDDSEELELFVEALNEINPSIDCLAYNDSRVALENLSKTDSIDIIFLDYNMPILTGEECLQKIRQMAHLREVPIVIYSAGVDEKLAKHLSQCGASMVIKKHQSASDLKKFFVSNFLTKQGISRQ